MDKRTLVAFVFFVVDKDRPNSDIERKKHSFFWGTFLTASPNDPRQTDSGLKDWEEKWEFSWVIYIMDVFGNIDYMKTKADNFMVTAVVDYVDCDALYDGCYIETTVKLYDIFVLRKENTKSCHYPPFGGFFVFTCHLSSVRKRGKIFLSKVLYLTPIYYIYAKSRHRSP